MLADAWARSGYRAPPMKLLVTGGAGFIGSSFVRYQIAHDPSVDAIVHFAAESHVDRSIEDSAVFLRTNVLGTQVMLEGARRCGVKRFLHISTDEVYGSLGPEGRFTEESPLCPSSPYAASKAAADLLVLSYVRTYGIDALVTRCSNNFGPYQFPEKVIPLFVTSAFADEPLPLYGAGSNVRDWIYFEDHCAALDVVLRDRKSTRLNS